MSESRALVVWVGSVAEEEETFSEPWVLTALALLWRLASVVCSVWGGVVDRKQGMAESASLLPTSPARCGHTSDAREAETCGPQSRSGREGGEDDQKESVAVFASSSRALKLSAPWNLEKPSRTTAMPPPSTARPRNQWGNVGLYITCYNKKKGETYMLMNKRRRGYWATPGGGCDYPIVRDAMCINEDLAFRLSALKELQ